MPENNSQSDGGGAFAAILCAILLGCFTVTTILLASWSATKTTEGIRRQIEAGAKEW